MIHSPHDLRKLAAKPGHLNSRTRQREVPSGERCPAKPSPPAGRARQRDSGPGRPFRQRRQVSHPSPSPRPERTSPTTGLGLGVGLGRLACGWMTVFERKRARPFATDSSTAGPLTRTGSQSEPGLEGWGHLSHGKGFVARGPLGCRTPSPSKHALEVPSGERSPAKPSPPAGRARQRDSGPGRPFHQPPASQSSQPQPQPQPRVPDGQPDNGLGLGVGLGRLACRSTSVPRPPGTSITPSAAPVPVRRSVDSVPAVHREVGVAAPFAPALHPRCREGRV
jgi:hypothetical protein